MSNQFYYNGHSCAEFNIICSNGGTYDAPERDVTVIEIPGRNGDVTLDNGRWRNASVTFPCYVRRGFAQMAPLIRAWLHGAPGYHRLEDDAHPYEYRMARFVEAVKFEPMYTDKEAELEISFSCQPQRWLKSGEDPVVLTAAGTLVNPTQYDALPTITVEGTGAATLTVGDYEIAIDNIDGSITLNSSIQRAYNGTMARDGAVTGVYPVLPAGSTAISWEGSGVTSVTVFPRWWTI